MKWRYTEAELMKMRKAAKELRDRAKEIIFMIEREILHTENEFDARFDPDLWDRALNAKAEITVVLETITNRRSAQNAEYF